MKRILPIIVMAMGTCGAQAQVVSDTTLQEVVVTATGTQHLLRDVPVQTEVISRQAIEAFGGKSVEEILGTLTASFAFNEGDMGSQMQLNGLGNNYILILIDGKRLHGDNGGENDLGLINPHNIDHIEIVKGAQSALYGSDAIAGVINIITKKRDAQALTLENSTRIGSYGDLRQHNLIGIGMGKWQSQTSFQTQHSDGWQNTRHEWTEATLIDDTHNKTANRFTNWQIGERITFTPKKGTEYYADGWYYEKEINRPTNGTHPSCDVYGYDLKYRNASAALGARWQLSTTDHLTADIDWNRHAYYYHYTAATWLEDGFDPQGNFTNYFPYFRGQEQMQADQQRTMASIKGVFALPAENTINVGAEYRYDYLDAPMRTKGGTADDWTAALYAQDEFNLLSWFNVTAGVRLIENDAFGFHATPKVSTMFSVGDVRLRLGWSQGFKTPTNKELNYQYLRKMGAKTYYYMGNANLRPQTSNYWSASAEYSGKRLTASVTTYVNSLDNMITLVNVPISELPVGSAGFLGDGSSEVVPRMYRNMEDAKTYGVDANLSYQFTRSLSAGGNYSYLDTDAHVYNGTHSRLMKVIIDGMAHHKWNAYITWKHAFAPTYRFGAGLYARGSSTRFYQNDGNGRHFQTWRLTTTHDFGQQKKKTSYRVELGIDNIFNHVDRTPRPYHLGTTTPGTTIYGTFSVKFAQGKKMKAAPTRSVRGEEDD